MKNAHICIRELSYIGKNNENNIYMVEACVDTERERALCVNGRRMGAWASKGECERREDLEHTQIIRNWRFCVLLKRASSSSAHMFGWKTSHTVMEFKGRSWPSHWDSLNFHWWAIKCRKFINSFHYTIIHWNEFTSTLIKLAISFRTNVFTAEKRLFSKLLSVWLWKPTSRRYKTKWQLIRAPHILYTHMKRIYSNHCKAVHSWFTVAVCVLDAERLIHPTHIQHTHTHTRINKS